LQNNLLTKLRWFVGPQSEWVCNDHGDLLVDYIGRFEALQKDFECMCEKLGLRTISALPHVNASDKEEPVSASILKKRLLF